LVEGETHEVSQSAAFAAGDLRAPACCHDRGLKILANQGDVPYQSLLKVFLAERLAAEWKMRKAG
jgi:hypothetical protein